MKYYLIVVESNSPRTVKCDSVNDRMEQAKRMYPMLNISEGSDMLFKANIDEKGELRVFEFVEGELAE